ncbi:MAG: VWA domain-containing protein [Acidobacteria bacterium]|nr:VWA domain-containing protein [Acidobacteriota bacterium]
MLIQRIVRLLLWIIGVPATLYYLVPAFDSSTEHSPYILHAAGAAAATEGTLAVLDLDGSGTQRLCPLEHTAVRARISGHLARVDVTQRFKNPYDEPIEAVYVFPLPAAAAVDEMTIRVGERTIRGRIERREEAQRIYEAARDRGQLAALLDQERPNIFTQALANIRPGESVEVNIRYVETLVYDAGSYEFAFPMVVGPRYMPGDPTGKQAGGFAPDTGQVPDASRISPRPVPPGMRAGHDLSLEIELDAGVALRGLAAKSHEILVERPAPTRAVVRLKEQAVIPNKDFVLRYDVAGEEIGDVTMAYQDRRGGYFSLVLEPPRRFTVEDVTPKELVFVLDVSGSMSGFPIEKAKETMKLALDGLYPRDAFNLITFAGETKVLFPQPVPATAANLAHAQKFLDSRAGGGGTEMMQAIRTALEPSDASERVRIVCFMTDGYIGNDMAVLDEIRKHPNARIFSFGIGSSTNRFLLDKMAELGRGEVEYVSLQDDGSAAARRFHERVRNPLLTDVQLDFEGLEVSEAYPQRLPDLFSAKPVVVTGRFAAPAKGTIVLRGKVSGEAWQRRIPVDFSTGLDRHDVVATLWARAKVADLMQQDFAGIQGGSPRPEIREGITQLGLDYRLMTQFTSFVAVEESVVTEGGKPRRVEVPVEMPEGVSYEGVFGGCPTCQVANAPAAVGGMSMLRQAVGFAGSAPTADRAAASPLVLKSEAKPKSAADADADALAKLDPKLRALVGQSGKQVEIEVWLADDSADLLAALRGLGYVETQAPKVAKIRRGRIAADKLLALARLEGVRFLKAI